LLVSSVEDFVAKGHICPIGEYHRKFIFRSLENVINRILGAIDDLNVLHGWGSSGICVGPVSDPISLPRAVNDSLPARISDGRMTQSGRLFGVEIEGCARCGGQLKVIASIEEPQLIAKILSHLERAAPEQYQSELPLGARGPPVQSRLLCTGR
jgi:hypothetical protein